jgi:6-pyruvoyltetrahydropterin/6-carboxytetrahydropterin synthase
MELKLVGQETIEPDGYLIDFGDIKRVARDLCKSLNEFFICPMLSDSMTITETEDKKNLCIQCEDGSNFSFPVSDCARLPIVHSSVEELTHFLWFKLVE